MRSQDLCYVGIWGERCEVPLTKGLLEGEGETWNAGERGRDRDFGRGEKTGRESMFFVNIWGRIRESRD